MTNSIVKTKTYPIIKRALDISVSLIALCVVSPLFLGLIVMNLCFLGPPIFFRQQRIGRYGHLFWNIKFRSLPLKVRSLPHEAFLSPYGRFIRKYSLDELPSLWNVLKGDISLIGPRPLLPEFFCPSWRIQMRPGMTGLAQVKGRNEIGWRTKFRYDLFYIKHASLKLDGYILLKTIPMLFSAKGTDFPAQEDYFPAAEDDCVGRHR